MSEETTRAMAESIRLKTKTGFCALNHRQPWSKTHRGQKKTGLVFIAASFAGGIESKGMIFEGSRDEIKLVRFSLPPLEFLYGVVSVGVKGVL